MTRKTTKRGGIPADRPLIAPSLLSCDFARIGEEVRAVEDAGADLLHIDVMDGHFVPNITIGPLIVEAVKRHARTPLDVHLMISDPDRYLADFADAGADILTVHWETCPHLHRTVQAIHALGLPAGVSLNPATPVWLLKDILGDIDMVLIMSVNPGFGGQRFIAQALEKISELRALADDIGCTDLRIEVDGGVTRDNAAGILAAGADILVSGSAVFKSGNYAEYITTLRG
ncbi:MAG: ribulose-phosphate 3-epimerase [Bacteroidota bacterium]|jgi:ribulose-phosphate 3-epimerase|nr:ribulose-phosphate 3-epimerase [Bacteroidota bacterium]